MNKAEQQAVKRLWERKGEGMTFLQFRRSVRWSLNQCWMVQWAGMWIGIESDGYTHS